MTTKLAGIRIAVVPGERCPTVAELRAQDSATRLLLLAVVDGTVVGSGWPTGPRRGGGFAAPRVLPEHRRRGVGSALLRALAEHCTGLGPARAAASVDDEAFLAFADHFGFVEVDREIEQVRAVGDETPPSALPAGVDVVTLSERPGCGRVLRNVRQAGARRLRPALAARDQRRAVEHVLAPATPCSWPSTRASDRLRGSESGHRPTRTCRECPDRVRRDWRGRGIAHI